METSLVREPAGLLERGYGTSIFRQSSVIDVQCCICVLSTWPHFTYDAKAKGITTVWKLELLAQNHIYCL